MNRRTFSIYLGKIQKAHKANPNWRVGQTYFNVLHKMLPDLANTVRDTKLDPFYDDTVLGDFLNHILNQDQ